MTMLNATQNSNGANYTYVITGDQVDLTASNGETRTIKLSTFEKNYKKVEGEPSDENVEQTEMTATVPVAKKGGKPVDPNSGRQAILHVLHAAPTPLSPKQINDALKANGREIKYISSHLNYFKAHGQIVHVEGTATYKLSQKTIDRLDVKEVVVAQVEVKEAVTA